MTRFIPTPTELKTANVKKVLNINYPLNCCRYCGAFVPFCDEFDAPVCEACMEYFLDECEEEFDI